MFYSTINSHKSSPLLHLLLCWAFLKFNSSLFCHETFMYLVASRVKKMKNDQFWRKICRKFSFETHLVHVFKASELWHGLGAFKELKALKMFGNWGNFMRHLKLIEGFLLIKKTFEIFNLLGGIGSWNLILTHFKAITIFRLYLLQQLKFRNGALKQNLCIIVMICVFLMFLQDADGNYI